MTFVLRSIAAAIGIVCVTVQTAAAQNPAPSLNGYVTVSNAYWDRGLAQNDGATLEAGVDYERPSGFFVGAHAANLGFALEYSYAKPRDLELGAYVGYHRRRPNWSWTATLGRYSYPGTAIDYDYNALGGSVGLRDRFFYTAYYTDDFYGRGRTAFNQEVSISQPLSRDFEVGVAVGHFRIDGTSVDFTHWNVGASKIIRRFVLDLRYYDSGYPSLSYLGDPSDEFVFSVTCAFGGNRRAR